MLTKSIAAAVTLNLALAPALASASNCEERKTIELSFPSSAFTSVEMFALAGSLVIESGSDSEILLTAKVCTSDEKYLDRMLVDVDDDDEHLGLTAVIPYDDFDWHADYGYMDIELTVPSNLPLSVRDSSGDIMIRDVNLVSLDDSSGDIRISHTTGDLVIVDSSGSIDLRDHKGNVEVSDSSGDVDIEDLAGNVLIPRDSSGLIEIDRVTGSVEILRDSAGDIEITDAESVVIESDGSGSIRVEDIRGSVEIGRDGSGQIRVYDIAGDLNVGAKGSGSINTRGIGGRENIPKT